MQSIISPRKNVWVPKSIFCVVFNSNHTVAFWKIGTLFLVKKIGSLLRKPSVYSAGLENFTNTFKIGYDRSHADHRNYRPYGFVRAKYGILADLDWTGELINSEYIGSYDLGLSGDLNVDLSFG